MLAFSGDHSAVIAITSSPVIDKTMPAASTHPSVVVNRLSQIAQFASGNLNVILRNILKTRMNKDKDVYRYY